MRTFIALDLDNSFREKLVKLIGELSFCGEKNIKWIESENLHITLLFLGETDINDLKQITEYCDDQFRQSPQILFRNAELRLIPGKNPRLIWIEMETECNWIHRSHKNIKNYLIENSYKFDKKPLKFHITLGRIKKSIPPGTINFFLNKKIDIPETTIKHATFYKSILKSQGPVYDPIAKFYFKGDQ